MINIKNMYIYPVNTSEMKKNSSRKLTLNHSYCSRILPKYVYIIETKTRALCEVMGLFSRSNIYLLGFLGSVFQSVFKEESGRLFTFTSTFTLYSLPLTFENNWLGWSAEQKNSD